MARKRETDLTRLVKLFQTQSQMECAQLSQIIAAIIEGRFPSEQKKRKTQAQVNPRPTKAMSRAGIETALRLAEDLGSKPATGGLA